MNAIKGYVERMENLIEEGSRVSDDRKELKAEIKGNGYDAAVIDKLVKIRADRDKYDEFEAVLDLYKVEMNMEASNV
ncbi:MAG: DUF2312 domain-containing protein [Rhizobiales bacterium]|nr:DUF2312 domain-containing protein [Hyphomicrobiales bacterium]